MNKHEARRARNARKKARREKTTDDLSSGCLLCKAWQRRMLVGMYVPLDPGKPTATYWLCLACTMSPGWKARVEAVLKERFGCDC